MNTLYARTTLPWKLKCDAQGLTRDVVYEIASSVELNPSGLQMMIVMAVLITVFEIVVILALCVTTSDEKVSKGTSFICPAILLILIQLVQLIFVFVFIAGYSSTDKDYQKILASSS
jgi:hypothetical protein